MLRLCVISALAVVLLAAVPTVAAAGPPDGELTVDGKGPTIGVLGTYCYFGDGAEGCQDAEWIIPRRGPRAAEGAAIVSASGSILVAFGNEDLQLPVAWVSADGEGWAQAEVEGDGHWKKVLNAPGGLNAIGESCDVECTPVMWGSVDGSSWAPIQLGDTFAGARLWDAAATDSTLIIVGGTGSYPNFEPAAWVSEDAMAWQRTSVPGNVQPEQLMLVEAMGRVVVAFSRESVWIGSVEP